MEESEKEKGADVDLPTGSPGVGANWTNGQLLALVPTSSWLIPTFDFCHCKSLLETNGFQIPSEDFETPLHVALNHPSVRRYLLFNSHAFHFAMAFFLYVVLWFNVYSTLHMYLESSTTDFWVLCLSVSLVSVILTLTIILIFHWSNKEMNMNTDVRLIGVNERMVRHRLLVGVADWMLKCRGELQLFCVYWNMCPCLRSLVEALEDRSFVRDQVQNMLKKRMSQLVLVTEVTTLDPDGRLDDVSDEERPLLLSHDLNASTSQREDSKLTQNFSLVPDTNQPNQAIAQQLLMIYSAHYIRLLMSNKLPASSDSSSRAGHRHCPFFLCLCEYVILNVLQ